MPTSLAKYVPQSPLREIFLRMRHSNSASAGRVFVLVVRAANIDQQPAFKLQSVDHITTRHSLTIHTVWMTSRSNVLHERNVKFCSRFHECDEHGFLRVEAVFGLLENRVGVEFENFFADFLAAVGWQAMEHNVIAGGVGKQLGIHLEAGELEFFFLLILLAHREPDIGVDRMGAAYRDLRIIADRYIGRIELSEKFGGWLAGWR